MYILSSLFHFYVFRFHFPTVYFHMPCQMLLQRKTFPAIFTRMGLHAGMALQMLHQIIFIRKILPAYLKKKQL